MTLSRMIEIPFEMIDIELPVVADHSLMLTIINCYLPCSSLSGFKEKISNHISTTPEPRLLLGDCNVYHQIWGSDRTDPRGIVILDALEDSWYPQTIVHRFINGKSLHSLQVAMASLHRLTW